MGACVRPCLWLCQLGEGSTDPVNSKPLDSGTGSRVHTSRVGTSTLRSGELARLTGVSADTLRHYERIGILPASERTNGGYRLFPPSAVERVQLAQRALHLGFSLKELSEILRIRDDGGVPCDRVLNLTEQKLRSLARQIQELQRSQDYLRKLVREWRSKLEKTPKGTRAMLLESLAKKPRVRPATGNLKRRPQR